MDDKLKERIKHHSSFKLDLSLSGAATPTPKQIALVESLTASDQALRRPEWTRAAVSRWLDDVLGPPDAALDDDLEGGMGGDYYSDLGGYNDMQPSEN